MRFTASACGSETHNLRLVASACRLLVVVPGVVHTFFGAIGSVNKSVDGSLYPLRISLSLKYMSHLLSLNVTVHPALHNTLIPKSDGFAKFGTICPVNIVGSPGMLMFGGPAQNLPKFQIPCLTPKSVQTCSIYSPDGDSKVSMKKMTPL
jgi:hypothetical protein